MQLLSVPIKTSTFSFIPCQLPLKLPRPLISEAWMSYGETFGETYLGRSESQINLHQLLLFFLHVWMLSTEFRDEDEWKKKKWNWKSNLSSPAVWHAETSKRLLPELKRNPAGCHNKPLARHGSELEMPFLKRFKMSGQGCLDVNYIYFLPDWPSD